VTLSAPTVMPVTVCVTLSAPTVMPVTLHVTVRVTPRL